MAEQHASTARDLLRGKRTEIDALNGYIARRGEALGVDVHVNRTLHALVKLRETERTLKATYRHNLQRSMSLPR